MIEYIKGDLLRSNAEAIVNAVNCAGVMGRGIALQFKKAYPENFNIYSVACKNNEVVPGKMLIYEIISITNPKYIINFPTKRHWKEKSKIEDIKSGLLDLAGVIRGLDLNSIALPALGCGLGGLDWNEVKQEIESAFSELPEVKAFVYEPN